MDIEIACNCNFAQVMYLDIMKIDQWSRIFITKRFSLQQYQHEKKRADKTNGQLEVDVTQKTFRGKNEDHKAFNRPARIRHHSDIWNTFKQHFIQNLLSSNTALAQKREKKNATQYCT